MSRRLPFAGLLDRLAGPLGRLPRSEDGNPPSNKVLAGFLPSSGRLTDENFRLAAEALVSEEDGKFLTRLHVVSLIEFREAVGDKWGRLADKVMMIGEGVIHQHLGSGNFFIRADQDLFVLIFRTCTPGAALVRAQAIARDLGTRLVGDQLVGMERPLALAIEVAAADAISPDGTIDLAALNAAIDARRALYPPRQEKGAVPPVVTEPEKPLPIAPSALVSLDDSSIEDPKWHGGEPGEKAGGNPNWENLQRSPDAAKVGPAPALVQDTKLSAGWRPTWVASAEAISAYQARIIRRDGESDTGWEGADAYPPEPASAVVLDRAVTLAAVRVLRAATATARFQIIVPLHWHTVSSVQRSSLAAVLSEIGESTRLNRMVFEIFGIPADVSRRELTDIVAAVRGFSRQVALRVALDDPIVSFAGKSGAAMIGIDLSSGGRSGTIANRDRALSHFRESAERARLPAYAWGVTQRAQLGELIQAGFAMINGPALMEDVTQPAKVIAAPKSRFIGEGS